MSHGYVAGSSVLGCLGLKQDWEFYEVHHKNWNSLDCRACNLTPKQKDRHRGEGRDGWQNKRLKHSQKVNMIRKLVAPKRRAGAH
jgi:hypothetical protein